MFLKSRVRYVYDAGWRTQQFCATPKDPGHLQLVLDPLLVTWPLPHQHITWVLFYGVPLPLLLLIGPTGHSHLPLCHCHCHLGWGGQSLGCQEKHLWCYQTLPCNGATACHCDPGVRFQKQARQFLMCAYGFKAIFSKQARICRRKTLSWR